MDCRRGSIDLEAAAQREAEFSRAVDQAIVIEKHSSDGGLEAAKSCIKLASSLVKQIAWEDLPIREVSRNLDMLRWYQRRIGSYVKGWNDAVYAATVKKAARVTAQLLRIRNERRKE